MSTQEMAELIGKEGLLSLSLSELKVRVRITDVLNEFGRLRYVVTPIAGEGSQKVNASRVSLDESQK